MGVRVRGGCNGIEAYHWPAQGSTHIPTPEAETLKVGIPWWRWKLLGDPEARKAFKALKGAGPYAWSEIESQNVPDCP